MNDNRPDFNQFSNLYSLSKTLRFSLDPQRKTLENIQNDGLLDQDEKRAADYKKVKGLIDEYHKHFIETALTGFELDGEKLEEYGTLYRLPGKDEKQKKRFEKVQTDLREQISKRLTDDPRYKALFKDGMIKTVLPEFARTDDERRLVGSFKDFTTYFQGFYTNRKNLYTDDAQSTAIAYRLVHDNLPKFIDNMQCFEAFKAAGLSHKLPELHASLGVEPGVGTIGEMFQLSYYNRLLTQSHIDLYNVVVGGKTTDKEKIQGLNELINLYNKQQTDRSMRLPLFKPLFKQILSDRGSLSWLPEQFGSDDEVLESIEACYNALEDTFSSLMQLLKGLDSYNQNQVYVDYAMLPSISQQIHDDWSAIYRALDAAFMRANPKKEEEKDPEYEERRQKYFKNKDACSISEVDAALAAQDAGSPHALVGHFFRLHTAREEGEASVNLFVRIADLHDEMKPLLTAPYPKEKNLAQDKESVKKLKNLLDAVKALQHFVAPLAATAEQPDKDERFYGQLMPLWLSLGQITPLYNKVRDYLTRKPYSVEKIKLNFENSTLMDGWDVNKIRDNTTVILRKDGAYFLAIMDKKHNKTFDAKNIQTDGVCYEKMDYKLIPGPNKMLPKVFFSQKGIREFNPSSQIMEIYKRGSFKKGESFRIEDCHALIDFYKDAISRHPDWKNFGFQFSETQSYNDISDFYREVETQGYRISFSPVSENYINRMVDEGKLYLFKIYSKDFSPNSKGTPNLHTIYWRMLFDPRNLADVSFQLNGHGEVFYRKPTLPKEPEKPTHPAGRPIANKRAGAKKKKSCFKIDLIKDERFTKPHFELHVPITLNFKSRQVTNINQMVNDYIRDADDLHVIGIDRGERNLLYLSLIDMQGRIVKQQSLNCVGETDFYAPQGRIVKQQSLNQVDRTDYHALLEKREGERQAARRSWQTIESIKELKEGYLSQAVRVVANWMVQYHAIVALENLNFGFKRGRQKVERQVYQKFEKMLIDKLNYLVDKKKADDEPGGALHAYQLANPFVSFEKMGRQSGFLFYVPAWNTSKIDPVTGFVNLFDTRYESKDKAKEFFENFDAIRYNKATGLFEFSFHYSKFKTKVKDKRDEWTLCSHGERIEMFKDRAGHWEACTVNLTEELKKLFKHYGVALDGDLRAAIVGQTDKAFFQNDKRDDEKPRGLMQLFRLMVQMRNSDSKNNLDYIISPVADAQGRFFDSRKVGDDLPKDADANGAYNIARKGLWFVRKIKEGASSKEMRLTNQEWLSFAQEKPYEG